MLALRRQRLTLQSIAEQLQLSRSTVARICARAGLNRLARLEPTKHAGWDFVHVAIDDQSRIGYVQILADEQGPSAATFLRLAVSYYAAMVVVIP